MTEQEPSAVVKAFLRGDRGERGGVGGGKRTFSPGARECLAGAASGVSHMWKTASPLWPGPRRNRERGKKGGGAETHVAAA